jgi:hypothetical protein
MNAVKDEIKQKEEKKLLKTSKVFVKNFYEKNPFFA